MLLNIKNLFLAVNQEPVLKNISLTVKPGELHVIMGPNGAGKSSLAKAIMGDPAYEVIRGEIEFTGQEIKDLAPEKRAKLGLALAYQNPPKVGGVKLKTFLRLIQQKTEINLKKYWPQAEELVKKELNHGLSGGEKKITELLQLLVLEPKLTIFDELDAGLDFNNWQKMANLIKKEFVSSEQAAIFISHQPQLVTQLKPDYIHIILEHKLICTSQDYEKVLTTIQEHDYEQCRHCPARVD